ANAVRLIHALRARLEPELLQFRHVLVGLDILQHDLKAFSDHRGEAWRPDIEIDGVYESVQRLLFAMSLERGVAQVHDHERARKFLEPLRRLEYGELHVTGTL